jgi:hypothetical protein
MMKKNVLSASLLLLQLSVCSGILLPSGDLARTGSRLTNEHLNKMEKFRLFMGSPDTAIVDKLFNLNREGNNCFDVIQDLTTAFGLPPSLCRLTLFLGVGPNTPTPLKLGVDEVTTAAVNQVDRQLVTDKRKRDDIATMVDEAAFLFKSAQGLQSLLTSESVRYNLAQENLARAVNPAKAQLMPSETHTAYTISRVELANGNNLSPQQRDELSRKVHDIEADASNTSNEMKQMLKDYASLSCRAALSRLSKDAASAQDKLDRLARVGAAVCAQFRVERVGDIVRGLSPIESTRLLREAEGRFAAKGHVKDLEKGIRGKNPDWERTAVFFQYFVARYQGRKIAADLAQDARKAQQEVDLMSKECLAAHKKDENAFFAVLTRRLLQQSNIDSKHADELVSSAKSSVKLLSKTTALQDELARLYASFGGNVNDLSAHTVSLNAIDLENRKRTLQTLRVQFEALRDIFSDGGFSAVQMAHLRRIYARANALSGFLSREHLSMVSAAKLTRQSVADAQLAAAELSSESDRIKRQIADTQQRASELERQSRRLRNQPVTDPERINLERELDTLRSVTTTLTAPKTAYDFAAKLAAENCAKYEALKAKSESDLASADSVVVARSSARGRLFSLATAGDDAYSTFFQRADLARLKEVSGASVVSALRKMDEFCRVVSSQELLRRDLEAQIQYIDSLVNAEPNALKRWVLKMKTRSDRANLQRSIASLLEESVPLQTALRQQVNELSDTAETHVSTFYGLGRNEWIRHRNSVFQAQNLELAGMGLNPVGPVYDVDAEMAASLTELRNRFNSVPVSSPSQ